MNNLYNVSMDGVRRTKDLTVVFTPRMNREPLSAFLDAAMAAGWAFCSINRLPENLRPAEMSQKDMPRLQSAQPVAFVSRFNAHDVNKRFGEWLGGEPMKAYDRIEIRKGMAKAYFYDLEEYDPEPFALPRLLHGEAFNEQGYRKDCFAPRSLPDMRPFGARRVGSPTLFLFPKENAEAVERFMRETGVGGWAVMDMDAIRGHFEIDDPDDNMAGLVSYYDRGDVAGYYGEWMDGPAYKEYAERIKEEENAAKRRAELWEKDPAPLT